MMRLLGCVEKSDFTTTSERTKGPSAFDSESMSLFWGPLRGRCVDYTEFDRKEHVSAVTIKGNES